MGYLTEIACTYCAIFIAEVLQINAGIDILILRKEDNTIMKSH